MLRDWMEKNGMNAADLARKAGIDKAYVSRVLSGQGCGKRVARAIERATDGAVKASEIAFGDDEDEHPAAAARA